MVIQTGQKRLHWGWLLLLSVSVAAFAFVEKCSGTALTFTLKKYISNPTWILFLGSINSLFAILIAPWSAYKSDHIQTFLGRRKTLIVAGFILLAVSLVLIPAASSLVLLIGLIVVYQFAVDLGYTGPWRPLYFDIVPKAQRGRGMVINRYASIAARFVFMFFLIGRFDEEIGAKKASSALSASRWATWTGEQVIYVSAAVLVLLSLGIILAFVRETKSVGEAKPRIGLLDYSRQMFLVRQNRLLCILVVSSVLMSTQLMNLRPLLITEQFGYSKQMFGNMHGTTMLINTTLVLPVLVVVIDRIDKFKLFAGGILLSTLHPIVFWTYVKFFAPGQIPSAAAIVAFNVADSIFDRTALLALWPFLFDIVDPARKGFMNSGFLIVAGCVKFVNTNLMGLWVHVVHVLSGRPEQVDYMSCYLYIFIVGVVACLGTLLFLKNRHQLIQPAAERPGPFSTRQTE
ncbi:MAG: hypothetical protein JW741_11225 [Sedimentisphaerales bacterium]|nr:hypothetical protein [Sedimentisphaerales bacterium]